ncbi:gliding motility-associated ABC transporter substrate-binding protein GldG [Lewinella cohaerens]|uniref:gliding motility-associated ABC transporter substrate-binding protein GldG n=1 Tax=Lewinella cohaerens TaxID=70995 RepID=UPI00037A5A0E|nr:gliding motility-associated ABC transporter substrate-binding protein GldG [Lewinella cohaerens]
MNRKTQTIIQFFLGLGVLLLINIVANSRMGGRPLYGALDLTEEKRYTLTEGTETLLEAQEDVIFVRVLLEGEFPAGFKRLQSATREMLEDFHSESPYIEYEFYNPNEGTVDEINTRREQYKEEGIVPVNLRVKGVEGTSTTSIFPYAIFYKGERSVYVNILENEIPGVPSDVVLNNAVALLEYKFANAIQKLNRSYREIIAFSTGQGELPPIQTADLEKELRTYYDVGRLAMDSVAVIPQDISALIIAKPTQPFSDNNKFKIDQYVMNGGKVMWLLDRVAVDLDSLQGRPEYYPKPYDLNIDDLLFRYGLRFNDDLVQDLRSTRIPLATGMLGNAPQFDLFRYPYHVLALPQSNHPIVRSLEAVNLFYPSSIDLSPRTKTPIDKTILLMSSDAARYQKLPVGLDFDFLRYDLDPNKFQQDSLVMGVLLEGTFSSMYENRLTPENLAVLEDIGVEYQSQSVPNAMIVVSDGDVVANPVRPDGSVVPLGYNVFEKYQFSNKDFLFNALEYLLDDGGIIQARGKEVRLRMLNNERAEAEATFWRVINIAIPVALLLLFGLVYFLLRRRKYGTIGKE